MKERQLKMAIEPNPTLVSITEDQGKKISKALKDLNVNLTVMVESLNKGTLNEEMRACHCSLSEHYLFDLLKELGYEGQLKKEMDERHAQIRNLNIENRELRRQLGEKASNEDVRERLKNIDNLFSDWWRENGFGHNSDTDFLSYGGYRTKLSGTIFRDKKKKVELLEKYGFQLDHSDSSYPHAIDCDLNKKLLAKLLKSRFPSAQIVEVHSWGSSRKENAQIRDVIVQISSLNDFREEA